jgi:DNA-binding GntR family transcriptional regulator
MPYVTPHAGNADAWAAEAASQGGRGTQSLAHVGEVAAPAPIAQVLGVEEGDAVVVRRRVVRLNDAPVELADSYYPARIASGTALAEPRKIKGGAVNLLAVLGYRTARVREDVTARMPTDHERSELRMTNDEPVLVLERVTIGSDGQPIQADVMVTPASLRRLRYDLKVTE